MNPTIRETDGIVLDTREHGESDLILTLFCRDGGRATAIAKGARKSLRRFVNKLEIHSFLHVTLRQRSPGSMALLEEAELHAGFIRLRKDIQRYTAASVIREFTLLATREGEADERSYALLLWAFHHLDREMPHLLVVMLFLLRFYDYIGYRPELRSCFHCGAVADTRRDFGFSTVYGGVVCDACLATRAGTGISLSGRTIKILQAAQDMPMKDLYRLEIPEQQLYEALNILHRYGRHVLGRDIISWTMLRSTLRSRIIHWEVQQ